MQGHQPDYVRHLVEYIGAQALPVEVAFLVHPRLLSERADVRLAAEAVPQVHMVPLTEEEAVQCGHHNMVWRDHYRFQVLRRYVQATGAGHALILKLDHFQAALATRRTWPEGCRISGILFRASIHYEPAEVSLKGRLRERMVQLRKRVLYEYMLRNPHVDTVFSLDSFFPEYARAAFLAGHKVQPLPDPVLISSPSEVVPSVQTLLEAGAGRVRFLLFGMLMRRKGVVQALQALLRLTPSVRARVSVILAGRLREEIAADVQVLLEQVRREAPEVHVHLEDRFLEEAELGALVQGCDVVLAPYQCQPGSSGVLLWAAGAGKPVLTQDYGYMGALTRTYRLGLTVDTRSPEAIAGAMTQFITEPQAIGIDRGAMQQLTRLHTPQRFAEVVLAPLLESQAASVA